MQRRPQQASLPLDPFVAQLLQRGEGAPPIEEKLQVLASLRAHSAETAARLDKALLEEVGRLGDGLDVAQEEQAKVRRLVERLTATPYFPAIFLGTTEALSGPAAIVQSGSERGVVGLADGVAAETLETGDEVLLAAERNVILLKSASSVLQSGETAVFSRYMPGGRVVVRAREEEFVVVPAGALRLVALKAGDQVRFDRVAGVAFEKMERARGEEYFLEDTPAETFADIGGLNREIARLQRSIALHCFHADMVRKYGLRRKKSVLLHGPPGTGKTMTARALANWMARLSKSGRSRFMNVKPGGLNSMWYGQTEANYREIFRVAREAGADDPDVPVLIFLDEVDSIGSMRGESVHRIDDRTLNAFMAELSGLEERGNIVVVTATNRLDTLDSALVRPGRLGDLMLKIPRPNRKAARDIFNKHLRAEVPCASGEHGAEAAREAMVDSAVSLIFSSNGESDLANITFRDGKRRVVRAGDLINGAEIAAMVQSATESACNREAEGGESGIALDDVLAAVSDFFDASTRVLSPANCHKYLEDLPQDVDVVRVEPVQRKVRNPHLYINQAA